MTSRKKIAVFVGNDITAQLVLNQVVLQIMAMGCKPIIYLPKHTSSKKADLPELRDLAFYERKLLNEVVYPFLERNPTPKADNLTPHQLAGKLGYGVKVFEVEDVNDPSFIEHIRQNKTIMGGLSIRCFQIFKEDIIDVFKERQFFLNLHPGVLPDFRGVMSTARAMASSETKVGWTLHEIDRGIDTGNILWISSRKLDPTKTVLMNTVEMANLGIESIQRALEEVDANNILTGHPQDSSKGRYYSYPTASELADWKSKGVRLAEAKETIKLLVSKFSEAGTPHASALEHELKRAVRTWEKQKDPNSTTCSFGGATNCPKSRSNHKMPSNDLIRPASSEAKFDDPSLRLAGS